MYLALLPNAQSERAIRLAVPDAGELHLTVIFSPERDVKAPAGCHVEDWWKTWARGSVYEHVEALQRFGPDGKQVWAIKMARRRSQGVDLCSLREVAETALRENRICWSQQWGFNPHVTLVKTPTVTLHQPLPDTIVFDRFEWRP